MQPVNLISDLHIDVNGDKHLSALWEKDHYPFDLLICGDLGSNFKQNIQFLIRCGEAWRNVIYIPGNHEYYGGDIPYVDDAYRNALDMMDNIHFVKNELIYFDEYLLYGGVMWTNIDPIQEIPIMDWINDFNQTKVNGQPLTCNHLREFHKDFMDALDKVRYTNKNFGHHIPFVVASHFLPHENSVHPTYKDEPTNSYFCAGFGQEQFRNVDYWLHGHTHKSMQYEVYGTDVYCNPFGYGKENKHFKLNNLIEIK
jgi:DNA repair exonuclease SbcCD nuclease subunit